MLTQFPLALLPLHEIMTKFHKIVRRARDPYRPELHYMRGPGPKWHARHANRPTVDSHQRASGEIF
jgi:hypothetical protein